MIGGPKLSHGVSKSTALDFSNVQDNAAAHGLALTLCRAAILFHPDSAYPTWSGWRLE